MLFIHTVIEFLKDKEYRDLLLTSSIILILGALTYHFLEGWSIIDSFYFAVITLTTIGYGDFAPQTDAGKIFTIFYIIVGLGMILSFIHTVYGHYAHMKSKDKKQNRNKKQKTIS